MQILTRFRGLSTLTAFGLIAVERPYYEDLWEGLRDERALPEVALRMAFLRGALSPGARVLDLGCGAGEFTAAAAAMGARRRCRGG